MFDDKQWTHHDQQNDARMENPLCDAMLLQLMACNQADTPYSNLDSAQPGLGMQFGMMIMCTVPSHCNADNAMSAQRSHTSPACRLLVGSAAISLPWMHYQQICSKTSRKLLRDAASLATIRCEAACVGSLCGAMLTTESSAHR